MTKELFLIAGKPGSGKSTVSMLAAARLGDAYHFSMGDEIRARALDGKSSQYGRELSKYTAEIKAALPIPPHLAAGVFEECIATSPAGTIIVDGYPQYPDRLVGFGETLERVGAKVLAICHIDIADEIAASRIMGRGRRFSDVTENASYIAKRLEGYRNNVLPTIETLSRQYPVHVIDGEQAPDAVAEELSKIINDYH